MIPHRLFSSARIILSQPKLAPQLKLANTKEIAEKALQEIDIVESKITDSFRNNDLQVLQSAFLDIQGTTRTHFADNPFWKLFWSGDYFATDLKDKLPRYKLLQAEYQVSQPLISQMAYASGKITGYVANLGPILNTTLRPLKEFIPSLQDLSMTDRQVATDPFFLRNQLIAGDDVDYSNLGTRITKLVRNQWIVQSLSTTFWLLTMHFGVPIVFSIPLGIFSNALGNTFNLL